MRKALEKTFQKNEKLYQEILEVHGSKDYYLKYLGNLFWPFLEMKCKGLIEKIGDINNLQKFETFLSELEVASRLMKNGKLVDFLPDSFMGESIPSPDLFVDGMFQSYIEVKKLTIEQSFDIILFGLRDFLKDKKVIVNVEFSEELSIPVLKRDERLKKEVIAEKSLEEFRQRFVEVDLKKLPRKILTEGATFEIYDRTKMNKGYPGVLRHRVIRFPDELFIEKIREDVIEKAKKRTNWNQENRKYYYFVALDCREHFGIDDTVVSSALYGSSRYYVPPLKPPQFIPSKEIDQAAKRGWTDFMKKSGILPNGQSCPEQGKEGIS